MQYFRILGNLTTSMFFMSQKLKNIIYIYVNIDAML